MKIIVLIIVTTFAALFVGPLSVVTIGMDHRFACNIVMQARSMTWPTTAGRIAMSQVTEDQHSEGTSYAAFVRYDYRVDDRHYSSNRIRYEFNFHGKRSARRAIKPYPAGREVAVHYNPRDPSQAVLDTRLISGGDLFAAMFLTPLNLITLACWMAIYHVIRRKPVEKPAAGGGVRVIEDECGVRVRLTRMRPLGVAGLWAVGGGFVMIFVILMLFGGGDLMSAALGGWAVIICFVVRAYRRMKSRIDGGWYDLVIDDAAMTVLLPRSIGAYGGRSLPRDQIQRVDVKKRITDEIRPHHTLLWWNDGGLKSATLLEARSPEPAEALAAWLRNRLDLENRELQAVAQASST